MYQQITIVGNLGDDPTMRYTPNGVPVTSFSLAVNRTWTAADGTPQSKTTWFRISAWQKLAEIANEHLRKGKQVLVIGEMEDARAWTDKNGELRASLEVRAREIKFLGSRADVAAESDAKSAAAAGFGGDEDAGSIPF